MGLIFRCYTFVRFRYGHFSRGHTLLPFAFVYMRGNWDGRSNVSISKSSGIVGILSIMLFLEYLGRNCFFMPYPELLSNLNVINKLSFSFGDGTWCPVCLYRSKVSCKNWCAWCESLSFAIVVVYEIVKRPVWCKAFVPWVPLLVTCHSLQRHLVLSGTRGKCLEYLLCFCSLPLCFEQSTFKCGLLDYWIVGGRMEHKRVMQLEFCSMVSHVD